MSGGKLKILVSVLIPPTPRWDTRIVLWILGGFFALKGTQYFLEMLLDFSTQVQGPKNYIFRPLILSLPIIFGLALIRMMSWARVLAVVGLWFFILAVISLLGPFADSDRLAAGHQIISIETKWAILAAATIPTLYFLHVLGKYKSDFRSGVLRIWNR